MMLGWNSKTGVASAQAFAGIAFASLVFAAPACTVESSSADDDEGGGGSGGGVSAACTLDTECEIGLWCREGTCTQPADAWPLGQGDGTAASVGLSQLYAPTTPMEVTDAAFDPNLPTRMWVLMRELNSDDAVCNAQNNCPDFAMLEGRTAIVDNPGTAEVTVEVITDPNAWHFMRRPTALAMTGNGTFATCHEARTGNFFGDDVDFIGPSLWSTDLDVYGIQPTYPGANGSHLDMLHQTPYCMGIAHESQNSFWLFNGNVGAIDHVDFKLDHGPGADDHSDGEYRRFIEGQLARVPNVPSHLAFHESGWLYIADTGNARVVRLDTRTGTDVGQIEPRYEPLAYNANVQGAVLEEFVPPGVFTQPSGLAIKDDLVYVSDYATSRVVAFDLQGNVVRELQLDFPGGMITGLNFTPDGRLLFVEKDNGNVWRIEPR